MLKPQSSLAEMAQRCVKGHSSSAAVSSTLATELTTAQYLEAAPARTTEPQAHVVHISGSDARASQNTKYPTLKPQTSLADMAQ